MGFAVAAGAYDRFMGRHSVRLAPSFADFAAGAGQPCARRRLQPGALTTELVRRLGGAAVAAVDPSEQFAAAARARHIGVDVRVAAAESHLTELCTKAGLRDVEETALPVSVEHATFEEWWEPFTLGVGPAGVYVTSLDSARQSELRERCQERLGVGPFAIDSRAWSARGMSDCGTVRRVGVDIARRRSRRSGAVRKWR